MAKTASAGRALDTGYSILISMCRYGKVIGERAMEDIDIVGPLISRCARREGEDCFPERSGRIGEDRSGTKILAGGDVQLKYDTVQSFDCGMRLGAYRSRLEVLVCAIQDMAVRIAVQVCGSFLADKLIAAIPQVVLNRNQGQSLPAIEAGIAAVYKVLCDDISPSRPQIINRVACDPLPADSPEPQQMVHAYCRSGRCENDGCEYSQAGEEHNDVIHIHWLH